MKKLSVKVKILFVTVTLSVMSLSVFAYLTFDSYMKDKMAFVYSSLSTETQSKSKLFSVSIKSYDYLLGSIISGTDLKSRNLSPYQLKYLEKNKNILGIYYNLLDKDNKDRVTLYETSNQEGNWKVIAEAPAGVSIQDPEKGLFLIKKILSPSGSYAALSFRQVELVDLLKSKGNDFNFFLNLQNFGKSDTGELGPQGQALVGNRISEIPMPSGLFPFNMNGEDYFISFAKLEFQNLIFINMIKKKKVFLIQDVFLGQVVLFLVLITSISLLIGTLAARWLTWHLDELTKAALDMENEKFGTKVVFTTRDELGILGAAFNSMGSRVMYLLDELKRYNADLEIMVAERTKALKKLTDIQKGMLNSLGQGFVLIDKEHSILPVYSKIAEEMFDTQPDQVSPEEIMGIKEEEIQSFKDLYELVFNQALDFDDMAKLNPEFRTNSRHQQIALNYAPIKNSDTDELEYVLVIGTDKTAEIESMEKFKKEWNFSQMIVKIASNRFSINKVISEAFNMLATSCQSLEQGQDFPIREVQRLIHTIKGSVSYFYIEEVRQLAHDLETYLTPFYDEKKCPPKIKGIILDKIKQMEKSLTHFIDQYDSIIQYKTALATKAIPMIELNKFGQILKEKDVELAKLFKAKFYKTKVAPFFQMYPSIVKDLSIKLNKEVNFIVEGGELDLPDGPWDELFGQLIHLVRNALDHGFESPESRESKGKKRVGTLLFKFEIENNNLRLSISDDGQGLDWKKIAAKDPTVKSEKDALERIKTGGISSKDEVSDVSGRGVGVSSVFATVEKWGGETVLCNKFGQGMITVITVPLHKKNLTLKSLKVA